MEYETNEKGQLLIDVEAVARDSLSDPLGHYHGGFSRYNGGWIKTVDGLDKSVTNGYSIKGNFVKSGINWNRPGLYLDCSIDGSRKNQESRYHLFVLRKDGTVKLLFTTKDGSWAVNLWKPIEEALKEPSLVEPETPDRLQELKKKEAELVEQLEKVRSEIEVLENSLN